MSGGVEVRRVTIAGEPSPVALPKDAVRILQNRSGRHVIFRAPFFDTYTSTFLNPVAPPETAGGPLGLHVSVTDPGPYYLPHEFRFDLPRSMTPTDSNAVHQPVVVGLYRTASAPVQEGWAVLRVRVMRAGTNPREPIGGVLLRVFRSPRAGGDRAIGDGMTDWRRDMRGEALVPATGIQRFRPGSGQNVIETDQLIEFEATRDSGFTGAAGQLPDVPRLIAGTASGIVRAAAAQIQILRPAGPLRVRAGREYAVDLVIP